MNPSHPPLSVTTLKRAVSKLADTDPDLARVVERLGPPPLWARPPGFATLVHIILEQQVSLASARAAFDKLNAALPKLDPEFFLTLDDRTLKELGFSGQKGRYCRELARAIEDGRLRLEDLEALPDETVCSELEKVPGIGPWTSSIYLLMVLLRPDVWPQGDLALHKAAMDIKKLEQPPTRDEFISIGEAWRPWRSVAARILWHHYLNPE
jgi:DNA-3-methyladenine glycosylase II